MKSKINFSHLTPLTNERGASIRSLLFFVLSVCSLINFPFRNFPLPKFLTEEEDLLRVVASKVNWGKHGLMVRAYKLRTLGSLAMKSSYKDLL